MHIDRSSDASPLHPPRSFTLISTPPQNFIGPLCLPFSCLFLPTEGPRRRPIVNPAASEEDKYFFWWVGTGQRTFIMIAIRVSMTLDVTSLEFPFQKPSPPPDPGARGVDGPPSLAHFPPDLLSFDVLPQLPCFNLRDPLF